MICVYIDFIPFPIRRLLRSFLGPAVLVLYLTQQLQYDDNEATVIFHTMNVLVFCCCIPGAIFSDCWLGKYWSSMLFSGFYLFGIVLLVVSAANVWVSSRT